MSFDPNQNAPMGHAPPSSSGSKKKWIFAGLGCFGLLTVLCVGGLIAVSYWGMGVVMNSAYEEARVTIENDEAVGNAVGRPVKVGTFDGNDFKQNPQGQVIEYTYGLTVEGSEKSGRAEVVVSGNPIADDWKVDSIEVTVDGEKIPVGELELDVNIEGE